MSLVSKVCCSSLAHIRNEARLRRVKEESLNVDNYADFAACIHLANVQKHFKTEGLLEWAKKKSSGDSSSSTSNVWFN